MKTPLVTPPRTVDHVTVWLSEALHEARRLRATDLHFFPGEDESCLWLRIDGRLHEGARYPRAMHDRAIARLRVLARVPDYLKEAVTEGRFTVTPANGSAERGEARLSIMPSLTGEKAVVRLLGSHDTIPAPDALGFSPALVAELAAAVARPQGLLLVVGPAGSGKSTTLAALLQSLYRHSESPLAVLTLEDPPEIPMTFATQVAVDPARGLTFASGLRALLRQDPEVILVGEIRDPETAQVALNAALTGHRLFSSLHTMNAGEALVRLQDMGAAPYLLASAIGGILSQRLVRRPCPDCGRKGDARTAAASVPGDILALVGASPVYTETPGCARCGHVGHVGRSALGEWSIPGAETAARLLDRQSARDLQASLEVRVPATREAAHALLQGSSTLGEIERLFLTSPPGRGMES